MHIYPTLIHMPTVCSAPAIAPVNRTFAPRNSHACRAQLCIHGVVGGRNASPVRRTRRVGAPSCLSMTFPNNLCGTCAFGPTLTRWRWQWMARSPCPADVASTVRQLARFRRRVGVFDIGATVGRVPLAPPSHGAVGQAGTGEGSLGYVVQYLFFATSQKCSPFEKNTDMLTRSLSQELGIDPCPLYPCYYYFDKTHMGNQYKYQIHNRIAFDLTDFVSEYYVFSEMDSAIW